MHFGEFYRVQNKAIAEMWDDDDHEKSHILLEH